MHGVWSILTDNVDKYLVWIMVWDFSGVVCLFGFFGWLGFLFGGFVYFYFIFFYHNSCISGKNLKKTTRNS